MTVQVMCVNKNCKRYRESLETPLDIFKWKCKVCGEDLVPVCKNCGQENYEILDPLHPNAYCDSECANADDE